MSSERGSLRGLVLTEDRKQERFIRHLLEACGFNKRRFYFRTAPSGRGAGEAWVLIQYPSEVKRLRSKSYQRRCLLAVRDGDALGIEARKAQLDEALHKAALEPRDSNGRIATPVPTWAIENWLLDLLGHLEIDEERRPTGGEGQTWKQVFEREHGHDEKRALIDAANPWTTASVRLPSLLDGRIEFARIEQ
jgi:hypothetical protein